MFYPALFTGNSLESARSSEEIIESETIAQSCNLFKMKIDFVNKMGVADERNIAGLIFLAIESRLIKMKDGSSESIAVKITGNQGIGKSYTLSNCLNMYNSECYKNISNMTSKNLYYNSSEISHKTLIITEAHPLTKDSDLAYLIRVLLTEGRASHFTTIIENDTRVSKELAIQGPVSLITTTVQNKLEKQLDDRMFTACANESQEHYKNIIFAMAKNTSGNICEVKKNEVDAWKEFHASLNPHYVIIPYAEKIADAFNRSNKPGIGSPRSFKRVLSAIKAVCILYQYQRKTDFNGRLIAEMSDYAIVYQLVNNCIKHDLVAKRSDKYLEYIANSGITRFGDIVETLNVKRSSVSEAIKRRTEQGAVFWCDEHGMLFGSENDLAKAKNRGEAYLQAVKPAGLPSPYELTSDDRWERHGCFFSKYFLDL